MRSKINNRLLLLILPFFFNLTALAQNIESGEGSSSQKFRNGVALFNESKYSSAVGLFEELQSANISPGLSESIAYYLAASHFELANPNGKAELKLFVEDHPGSGFQDAALFRLANSDFNQKKYKEALNSYSKIDADGLSTDEKDKFIYNSGISLLETGARAKAKANFNQLRHLRGPLGDGSKYYWAHISFLDGKYDDALLEFKKLENTPVYFKLIPYYQVQIKFAKGDYEAALSQGVPLIEKATEDRKPELARILVISYYQTGQYTNASSFIDEYFKSKDISRADCYVAGFCKEKSGEPDEAIQWYEKSIQKQDLISQGTYYQLGGLYMKKGEKQKGLMAFQHASEMKFDPKIRQDALFQYAKATYELDYSPFNESIKAFDKYIAEYPDSKENDLAYNYLVNVFMTTRNYKDAMVSLDHIKVKSPSIKKAMQRVALYRGMEVFRDLNFPGAMKSIDKSLEYGDQDSRLKAQAQYWKAETYYRLGKVDLALAEYKKFQTLPGSLKLKEYALSCYNIGYICFNKQDLSQATANFTKFISKENGEHGDLLADAYNRLGDCQYAERNFEDALTNYQKAIDTGSSDADYALYQKAFTHGLMQDQTAKIAELGQLTTKYPESTYCDDALFETGKAYEKLSNFESAKVSYQNLIEKYPNSSLIAKALLQLGLISYNQNQYEESLGYYKEVVQKYPDTPEARGALTGIKNNYMENNKVDEYITYTKKVGKGATPSENEQDSLSYFSAEKLYMNRDVNAKEQLTKYINNFPKGNFMVNARYYRAECSYTSGDIGEALQDYEVVLSQPDNLFTENSLEKAAELAYDGKDYNKALGYYDRIASVAGNSSMALTSQTGTFRCNYELKNWDAVTKLGWKIKSNGKIPQELDREISYKSAKAYEALSDPTKALPLWRKLSADAKSKEGAEAKYNVCKYYFDNGRLKDAENEVMDFISKNSPQKFWLGKSFLLLAKIYERMNDLFQATNTLKSVIENYDNKEDGVIDEATAYLKLLEQKSK